jgi:hypothetical protein
MYDVADRHNDQPIEKERVPSHDDEAHRDHDDGMKAEDHDSWAHVDIRH